MKRIRALFAVLLIAALAFGMLSYRARQLDVQAMIERVADDVGVSIASEHVSLDLLPTPGVRLRGVAMSHGDAWLLADEVEVHAQLVPLLLGKVELGELRLNRVSFHLPAQLGKDKSWVVLARLMAFRRVYIRHGRLFAGTRMWLPDFYLDVRDIGRNRDAYWEFQSMLQGRLLRAHGSLNFRQGNLAGSFGKLKCEQLLLSPYRALFPPALAGMLRGDEQLSGSATFHMQRDHAWTLFGEGRILRKDEVLLRLRGKLASDAHGFWRWRDAFVHFDQGAVLGLEGQCRHENCQARLHGKRLPLALLRLVWAREAAMPQRIDGRMRLDARVNWRRSHWLAAGNLRLHQPMFVFAHQAVALPDMQLKIGRLDGHGGYWSLAEATVQSLSSRDGMQLEASYDPRQGLVGKASKIDMGVAWVPLGNLLLASLGESPALAGAGRIQGAVRVSQQPRRYTLAVDIDASGARIDYAHVIRKPEDMRAQCQFIWQRDLTGDGLELEHCFLGDSGVDGLHWRRERNGRQHVLARGAVLELAQLRQLGLNLMPAMLPSGRVSGDFNADAPGHVDLVDWIARLSGELDLQGVGGENWQLDGHLSARRGRMEAKHLRLILRQRGYLDLAGHYDLAKRRGAVDVLGGRLVWHRWRDLTLPPADITLHGRLENVQLRWPGQDVQKFGADYRWQADRLLLENAHAQWGEMELRSRRLELRRKSAGEGTLAGDLEGRDIPVAAVPWLAGWPGLKLQGRVHARLAGMLHLPFTGLAAIHAEGRIALYAGRWQLADRHGRFRKLSLVLRVVDGKCEADRLVIEAGGHRFTGRIQLDRQRRFSGSVREGRRQFAVEGRWPQLRWREVGGS